MKLDIKCEAYHSFQYLINPQIKRSPVSVNRMRAALSAMFKFAIQHDYVNAYPTHKVPSKIKITRRAS